MFKTPETNSILLQGLKEKVKQVSMLGSDMKIKFKQQKEEITIPTEEMDINGHDTIILGELK